MNQFTSNSKWNVSQTHGDYEYFSNFIQTVLNTDIASLQDYLQFDQDERLENVDLYEVTMMVLFFVYICQWLYALFTFYPTGASFA